MGAWSELPEDLLKIIEEYLVFYSYKVRCRCICASWRSILPKLPDHKQLYQLPWLLIPEDANSKTCCGFFNLVEKKVYHLELPKAGELVFRGSSHGWVVTVEEGSPAIGVINPLTKVQVQLPPRTKFPDVLEYFMDKPGEEYAIRDKDNSGFYTFSASHVQTHLIDKIVLSSSPNSKDYVAVAIYGEQGRLAYCKCGDKEWTFLHGYRIPYSDIIFHEGQLYALTCRGQLMFCDFQSSCPRMTEIVPNPSVCHVCGILYLVETSAGLMMVERNLGYGATDDPKRMAEYKTVSFKVYKLDDTSRSKWCPVKTLGGDMLLLGFNSSLSMSSYNVPGYVGNRIYFTDNNIDSHEKGRLGGYDVGVYSLDDGSVEPLPGYTCDPPLVWPPPVWVVPNPY